MSRRRTTAGATIRTPNRADGRGEAVRFGGVHQRRQWHKRENVVAYLPKAQQPAWRRKLERAYAKPTYQEAKAALAKVRRDLVTLNESAARSLHEGLEETLTLHRLGGIVTLGISLRTTNCIESINSFVERRTGKVDHWKTSNQPQRWLATALLDIEPHLRRIRGCRHLPLLRQATRANEDRDQESCFMTNEGHHPFSTENGIDPHSCAQLRAAIHGNIRCILSTPQHVPLCDCR